LVVRIDVPAPAVGIGFPVTILSVRLVVRRRQPSPVATFDAYESGEVVDDNVDIPPCTAGTGSTPTVTDVAWRWGPGGVCMPG
jgi:hypothetical protein